MRISTAIEIASNYNNGKSSCSHEAYKRALKVIDSKKQEQEVWRRIIRCDIEGKPIKRY